MISLLGLVKSRVTVLDASSKLCFGAAAGFLIVGTAAWGASLVGGADGRLASLMWIGVFYFVLGACEQAKLAIRDVSSRRRRPSVTATPPTTERCQRVSRAA
jgi:hypothetical protein